MKLGALKAWKNGLLHLALIGLTGMALLQPGAASAAMFKCKSADGSITFSDKACAPIASAKARAAERPVPFQEPVEEVAPPAKPMAAATAVTVKPDNVTAQKAEVPAEPAQPSELAVAEAQLEDGDVTFLKKEPTTSKAMDGVMWLGVAVVTLAWLFMMNDAWQMGHKFLSFLMFLFSPLCLIYPLISRERIQFVALVGFIAGTVVSYAAFVPGIDLLSANTGATGRADATDVPKQSQANFSVDSTVWIFTEVNFKPRWWERKYYVDWVWYTGGLEASNYSTVVEFKQSPMLIRGYMPAEELGAGSHHVEVYIDGELIHAEPFFIGS